jgi:hypothetical protein
MLLGRTGRRGANPGAGANRLALATVADLLRNTGVAVIVDAMYHPSALRDASVRSRNWCGKSTGVRR